MLLASRQNYNDFVTLIGRPDLEETDFWKLHVRFQRRDEFLSFVHAWSTTQTTADIIELLSAFRIPVTPVGNGATVPTLEQCVANDVFTVNPSGGFPQPRVPYTISDIATQPFGPAPTLQDRTTTPEWATPRVEAAFDTPNPDACELPLSGIRVIDFTSYWAGPEATDLLGVLGAEVIKVESPFRPDPERAVSERLDEDEWWEYGANFHGTDRNKRGIAIDLSAPTGQEVMLKLVATADVVIENFRPGVLDRLGLTLEAIRDVAPRAVLVRMPAFGLAGPWKMRGAFGPNIEQVTGMAFSTGYGPEEPIAPGGPCDPIAGTHAAFATLAALQARDRSGNGNVVVATMFEAGLNVAAELVIEQAAYSHLVQPRGNRGPEAVPQGAFLCAGDDNWVAIAVESAYEWLALHRLLDLPERLAGPEFLSVAGRREVEDEIEATLAAWCATREQHEICRILEELRIPAEPITTSFVIDANPQLQARGFFETVKHSLVGDELHPSVGFQFASRTEPWLRRAAPTLGEHNDEVLTEIGLTQAEIDDLYATQIIGTTWLTRR
jgi:crotonobetainyl-CoA:carnitine CoA-transferase CaiB-like acyl-CoA transferase